MRDCATLPRAVKQERVGRSSCDPMADRLLQKFLDPNAVSIDEELSSRAECLGERSQAWICVAAATALDLDHAQRASGTSSRTRMAPFGPADSRAASHCCADPIGAAQRGLLGASEADWRINGLDDSQNQGGFTHLPRARHYLNMPSRFAKPVSQLGCLRPTERRVGFAHDSEYFCLA
jgi:hypothetical protein